MLISGSDHSRRDTKISIQKRGSFANVLVVRTHIWSGHASIAGNRRTCLVFSRRIDSLSLVTETGKYIYGLNRETTFVSFREISSGRLETLMIQCYAATARICRLRSQW